MDITSVSFRCAAIRPGDVPREPFPQVAVAGRSNVGKSSLLNWLFRQSVARVAKAPGKTRTLNFYLVNRNFYLVDLPGYGYAQVSNALRVQWQRELGRYLAEEERLAGVVALLDVRHGVLPNDLELLDLVQGKGRNLLVVLTKADKVGRQGRVEMQRKVQLELGLPTAPLAVSVHTGEGRRELMTAMDGMLNAWRTYEANGDHDGT